MRLSSRFLTSLATGGVLLALPAPYLVVHAETPEPPAAPPAQTAPQPEPPKPESPKTETPKAETPTEPTKEAAPEPAPAAPAPAPAEAKPAQEPQPKAEPKASTPSAAQFKSELPMPRQAEAEAVSTDEELAFVALVNEERARRGLSSLRIDPLLIRVARKHSEEMRDKAYFSHESPTDGIRTPLDRFLQLCTSRPSYACVGENLFWATVTDVKRGHEAFMNSPTHRENVLFPRYEKIGVGIVKRGTEFWVTQMYLSTTDPVSVAKNRMSK